MGGGGLGEKGEGIKSTNWLLPNSHRDIKYSLGNVDNNVVMTMCGARWALEISGGQTLCKVYDSLTTILHT